MSTHFCRFVVVLRSDASGQLETVFDHADRRVGGEGVFQGGARRLKNEACNLEAGGGGRVVERLDGGARGCIEGRTR
eukprot:6196542-Pleurochrysis_carterae.AAC.1